MDLKADAYLYEPMCRSILDVTANDIIDSIAIVVTAYKMIFFIV